MRPLVILLGVAGLALAAQLEPAVPDPALPPPAPPMCNGFTWYAIDVSETTGAPATNQALARNPAEMRAVYLVQHLRSERDIGRLDAAVRRAWAGEMPLNFNGEGWHDGGGSGIHVNAYHVVRFGCQHDGMWGKYSDEAFEMPLEEFRPLWRDWAASARLYNHLLDKHGVDEVRQGHRLRVLPREHWPQAYPPSDEA